MRNSGLPNAIPVMVMDDAAYKSAFNMNNRVEEAAKDFLKAGGRIMLIGGLNRVANDVKKDVIKEAAKIKTVIPYLPI
ncbi:hypothetical protein DCM91_12335 [Chitinophaga costaii]|nr:hypothetical protein DCM91_12335 [Chitinophaga costaii]